MINASDILRHYEAQPFEPFLIRVSDGRAFIADRPEFLGLSRSGAAIYFSADNPRLLTILVSQIASIEKVNAW